MAIRFNLRDFLQAGAQIGTASLEGALAGEQQRMQEQQTRLTQQNLLSEIANRRSMEQHRNAELGLRQEELARGQRRDLESDRRADALSTLSYYNLASPYMSDLERPAALSQLGQKLGIGQGQGQPQSSPAPARPQVQGPTMFGVPLQQQRPQPVARAPLAAPPAPSPRPVVGAPVAPLQPQQRPGTDPRLFQQTFPGAGAQTPPTAPPVQPGPPAQPTQPGGSVVQSPVGEFHYQPRVDPKAVAAARAELARLDRDFRKSGALPSEKKVQFIGIRGGLDKIETPEDLQHTHTGVAQLNALMQGEITSPATGGQQQQHFLSAVSKLGLKTLRDPDAMRRFQQQLWPEGEGLTDEDLIAFAGGRAEQLAKTYAQQLSQISKMGPKAQNQWAMNINRLYDLQGTPFEITGKDIAGLNAEGRQRLSKSIEEVRRWKIIDALNERKFTWQRHKDQININKLQKEKQFSEAELKDISITQDTITRMHGAWQSFTKENRNALIEDFDPTLAYDATNNPTEKQGSDIYMGLQAQQQHLYNILKRHGVDPEADTPQVEEIPRTPGSRKVKEPGKKIFGIIPTPDTEITVPKPPPPPKRRLLPPTGQIEPLGVNPPAAKATAADIARVKEYIKANQFDKAMGMITDPVKRQKAKDAYRRATGKEWKGAVAH